MANTSEKLNANMCVLDMTTWRILLLHGVSVQVLAFNASVVTESILLWEPAPICELRACFLCATATMSAKIIEDSYK